MMLKGLASRIFLSVSLLALNTLFHPFTDSGRIGSRYPQSFHTAYPLPSQNGNRDVLERVSLEGMEALPVVQQPKGWANYVSSNDNEFTQFAAVTQDRNIALLAHNYLSGRLISQLSIGQNIQLWYEDGTSEQFVVTEILRYQALEPGNPYGSFRSLADPNEILSVADVFNNIYLGERHLTFQTCIAREGISSWGRLFVIAMPKTAPAELNRRALRSFP